MNNEKIIQIIPNSQNVYAKYKVDPNTYFSEPIPCFALVEYENNNRCVIPMTSNDKELEPCNYSSNYIGMTHRLLDDEKNVLLQTKLFREDYDNNIDDLINEWLEENSDASIIDIKITNNDENLVALVIYK